MKPGTSPKSSVPFRPGAAQLLLMDLTTKLVLLLALAKAPRVSELRLLNPRTIQWLLDGACIQGNDPAKTQRDGAPRVFFVPTLPNNVALCPVDCLKQCIKTTGMMRTTDQQKERLLLTTVRPHTSATADTVSHWLKMALKKASVNTNHFKAHSACGAATTAAVTAGVTMADILAAADWRGESTFLTRYYRPHPLANFGRSVLSSGTGTLVRKSSRNCAVLLDILKLRHKHLSFASSRVISELLFLLCTLSLAVPMVR